MITVRPGQDTVLSWTSGAVDCRVVAAAGSFVLLRAGRLNAMSSEAPQGRCALTFLDGMVPMGWDGTVEPGSASGELRFQIETGHGAADRRTSVRLPHTVAANVTIDGSNHRVQTLDVSAGGVRFLAPMRFTVGSEARIRARLAENLELDADSIVRSAQPDVAAVEFTALHAASVQEIGAWTVACLRDALAGHG